jgi:hypothetical protein
VLFLQPPMPDEELRAALTVQRARRGRLPLATPNRFHEIAAGCALACNGCGETIQPTDVCHRVTLAGLVSMRFHGICYRAWATFER